MALTPSTSGRIGTRAPPFSLPDTEGRMVSLPTPGESKATLVVFMCNHCPYVVHIADELARLGRSLPQRGIALFGINSNDFVAYPADGPEAMRRERAARGYTFPYLLDEDQSVARAYDAACTPDLFLFDAQLELVYRGELDSSRPASGQASDGASLRAALDTLLAGEPIDPEQRPSIGCSIKWKTR